MPVIEFYDSDPNIINNEFANLINDSKNSDSGYNKIYRYTVGKNGLKKKTAIEIYTTGGIGSNIRDAETGVYYTNKVGSIDENLFYKVILSTGECKKKSNTLFFRTPRQFMKYLQCDLSEVAIQKWQDRYDDLCNGKNIREKYRDSKAEILVV